MARTSVNIVVLAGSAATLAASLAGIARSEGYFGPTTSDSVVASVATETVAASTPYSVQVPGVQLGTLSPLAPLQLSPSRSLNVPQAQLDVQAFTRIEGSGAKPTSGGTPLTLSVQLPASTSTAASAAPQTQTIIEAPAQPVAAAPAPAAPASAPVLVAPPPPPPAPAPAPAPAANTKAS